jgi:hypothetical protein
MKRPRQHEVDSLGQTQLRAALDPDWTLARIEDDYGVDFDVELFETGESTGITFKLQLKSSESSSYSEDGTFVSQPLNADSARYLATELRVPTVLVHADVSRHRTFWCAPQLDASIPTRLSESPSSITVRIPTAQELPATKRALRDAIVNATVLLATRAMASAPVPTFLGTVANLDDPRTLLQHIDEKADVLRIQEAHACLVAGDIEGARAYMVRLADPSASPMVRFNAFLLEEEIGVYAALRGGAPDREINELRFAIARRVQRTFRKGPKPLKFYGFIMRKTAELDELAHADFSLGMAWAHAQTLGDAFWDFHLATSRAIVASRVNRCYRQCVRLLSLGTTTPYRGFLVQPLLRMVPPVGLLLRRLRCEGSTQQAEQISSAALRVCDLCARLADELGDQRQLASAAHAALMIDSDASSPTGRWAQQTFSALADAAVRRDAYELLDRIERRNRGERLPGDAPATPRQIFGNLATALGVNLADDKDPIARVIRIGIADFDPSRVLKDCGSLHVHPLDVGLPGIWLGLPTAGSKLVHCARHGHTLAGFVLDQVYDGFMGFKETYCATCPDRRPRPDGWAWSIEYQKAAEERYREAVRIRRREASE